MKTIIATVTVKIHLIEEDMQSLIDNKEVLNMDQAEYALALQSFHPCVNVDVKELTIHPKR